MLKYIKNPNQIKEIENLFQQIEILKNLSMEKIVHIDDDKEDFDPISLIERGIIEEITKSDEEDETIFDEDN